MFIINKIVSKFHIDVIEALKKSFPIRYTIIYSEAMNKLKLPISLEIDLLVTKISSPEVNQKDCWLAIEVNGVWHYPRNSMSLLGKDILKKKILETYNPNIKDVDKITYVEIPYYDWNVLENSQRSSWLAHTLFNSLT